MHTLDLHGFSYTDRKGLLPYLNAAFTECGGWVLERKTTSPHTLQISFEIQLRSIVDLYASLVVSGLELSRTTHAMLTDLCTCRHHLAQVAQPNQVISLRLDLSFLDDVTLESLLMTGSGQA